MAWKQSSPILIAEQPTLCNCKERYYTRLESKISLTLASLPKNGFSLDMYIFHLMVLMLV